MVRHIVTWNFKEGFTENENKENAQKIKSSLEDLTQVVDGIIELTVCIAPLPSSNRDILLNSLFQNKEALSTYQTHPEHKKIGTFISTVLQNRSCIDYNE